MFNNGTQRPFIPDPSGRYAIQAFPVGYMGKPIWISSAGIASTIHPEFARKFGQSADAASFIASLFEPINPERPVQRAWGWPKNSLSVVDLLTGRVLDTDTPDDPNEWAKRELEEKERLATAPTTG